MADIAPPGIMIMRGDFIQIRRGLSDYAREHGQFPDSLEQLPDLKEGWHPVDPWKHPYQYGKTADGYRLLSLGRDGKPGGVGLDADIDSEQGDDILIEPTLSQFLFEAKGGRTLFNVAIVASLFAGLACYLASGTKDGHPAAVGNVLGSIVISTISATVVSLFLVMIYLSVNHH